MMFFYRMTKCYIAIALFLYLLMIEMLGCNSFITTFTVDFLKR